MRNVLTLLVLGAILVGCGSNDSPNDPSDKGKGVGTEGRSIKQAAGAGAPGGAAPSGAAPSAQ